MDMIGKGITIIRSGETVPKGLTAFAVNLSEAQGTLHNADGTTDSMIHGATEDKYSGDDVSKPVGINLPNGARVLLRLYCATKFARPSKSGKTVVWKSAAK